jgi:hypothetical protein
MKLCCDFEFGDKTVRSEVYLEQDKNTCSVSATIIPCETIDIDAITNSNFFLKSIINSSRLLLERTPIFFSQGNFQGTFKEIKAKLSSAKLSTQDFPSPNEKVSIYFYLTNISYPFKPVTGSIEEEGKRTITHQKFYEIHISGQSKIIIKPYSEETISHIAVINEVPLSDLDDLTELIDSICWLISFGSGCMCSIVKIEMLHNEQVISLEYKSIETSELNKGNKVIYREEDIIQFIEHTYIHYQICFNNYKLKKLINLAILAKNTPYLEFKTLLMCNFLEILRYNYAEINVHNGNFTKNPKDDFFNSADQGQMNRLSFNNILQDFCQTNQLNDWIPLYKDIRNNTIHQGEVIGTNFNEKYQNYLKLHHFCDRVILALLNWDQALGYYIPRDCPSKKNANECGINRIQFIK